MNKILLSAIFFGSVSFLVGSCGTHSGDMSCKRIGIKDGDSVFLVSIKGHRFEHNSSDGGISIYTNISNSMYRVRVGKDTRGTFTGQEIDHYYSVHGPEVIYLGSLKYSYFLDETNVNDDVGDFHMICSY